MDNMSIAAQLYTLREFLKTPEDIEKTLKRVKEIGYNAIQVSGMGPIDPTVLKEIADKNSLKICVSHISFDRLKNDLENVIKEHKIWKCEYVGLGAMPSEYRTSKSEYLKFIEDISPIARKIKDNGLQFVYHNHKFEFQKFEDSTGMDLLFNKSDSKTFGFEIDTYWVQAGGANPVDWIKKVKGRMGVVHLKDMAILNDQQVYAEIGGGNLNWQEIITACRETGVKWFAVEQDICQRNPFESLEISLKYLQQFI